MLKMPLVLYGCICLSACGSLPTQSPSVMRHENDIFDTLSSQSADRGWSIANLRPSEDVILLDGNTVLISIDMTGYGNGQYNLILSTTRGNLHPFELTTIEGEGEISFAGTITWDLDVYGTGETVIMSLYRIDHSESGKTVISTLIKEIRREYKVICDKNDFYPILCVKRFFGLCNYE